MPLVQPHRADVHRVARPRGAGPRRGSARSSRRRCRSPAPASAGGRAQVARPRRRRTAPPPRRRTRPRARPRAARARRRRSTSAFAASRVAEVATNRTRGRPRSARISAAYSSSAANVRASASSASRPVRSTSWPSRTIRISRDVAPSGSDADQQLDRCWCRSRSRRRVSRHGRRRPGRPPLAELRRAPRRRAGSRPRPCASDWAASTCRHLTRSGMPPAEMPSISGTSPRLGAARRGSARARARYAAASSGSSAEPVLHLLHQPRALERADPRRRPRAGQVVGRRERRAVRQPRLGGRRRRGCRTGSGAPTAWIAARARGRAGLRWRDVAAGRSRRASSQVGVVGGRSSISGPACRSASAGCRPARPTPTPCDHHAVGAFARDRASGRCSCRPGSSGLPSSSRTT